LVEAGMHFGHRVSRWNPKMAPYIFGKRNLIHIIDLKETIKGLIRSARFLARVAAEGEEILFVGTKRQARVSVETEARRCGMPFVTERWLGGTLTNFRTITSRVKRLEELEELESTGRIQLYSKKMIASLQREMRKMRRNLEGIRNMKRLPGVLAIVDPHHEKIAVAEARKLGIPVVCLADTDSDPDLVDILTVGNDDAIRSIQLYVTRMADAVLEGKRSAPKPPAAKKTASRSKPAAGGRGQKTDRSRRGGGRGGGRRTATRTTQRLPGGKTIALEKSSSDRRGGRRGGRGRPAPAPPPPPAPAPEAEKPAEPGAAAPVETPASQPPTPPPTAPAAPVEKVSTPEAAAPEVQTPQTPPAEAPKPEPSPSATPPATEKHADEEKSEA